LFLSGALFQAKLYAYNAWDEYEPVKHLLERVTPPNSATAEVIAGPQRSKPA
jgi:hypothetical protein